MTQLERINIYLSRICWNDDVVIRWYDLVMILIVISTKICIFSGKMLQCDNFFQRCDRSGRWPNTFFVVFGTRPKCIINEFAWAARINNKIFQCHTVTNGIDLRRSPLDTLLWLTQGGSFEIIQRHQAKKGDSTNPSDCAKKNVKSHQSNPFTSLTIFNNSQHPHLSLDLPSSGNFIIGLQWLQKGCNALEVSGCKRTVEAGTAQSPSAAARTNTSIFLFFSPISFSLFFSSLLQIPLVPITSSGR